eukprot:1143906-Pelagomonas_calceolata.AAC.1
MSALGERWVTPDEHICWKLCFTEWQKQMLRCPHMQVRDATLPFPSVSICEAGLTKACTQEKRYWQISEKLAPGQSVLHGKRQISMQLAAIMMYCIVVQDIFHCK